MNKTFKVASNALRGCVVCSEKASSYQGRAIKTVVATAVAAVMAGAAGAAMAATDAATAVIGAGATVTVKSDGAQTPAVKTTTEGTLTYLDAQDAALKDGQIGADTKFKLQGGTLTITADSKTGTAADYQKTVSQISGGTVNLTSFSSKTVGEVRNAEVTYTGGSAVGMHVDVTAGKITTGDVTLSFAAAGTPAAEGTGQAVSTFKNDSGKLTLGVKDNSEAGLGAYKGAKVTLDVAAGAVGKVQAVADLSLDNVDFQIAENGVLTLVAGATVGQSNTVIFGSDYASQKGKLAVEGVAEINKNFAGTTVLVGGPAQGDKTAYSETFNDSVTVSGKDASVTAETAVVNGKTLTVQSGAAATLGTLTIDGTGKLALTGTAQAKTAATVTTLKFSGSNQEAVSVGADATLSGDKIVASGTNTIVNAGTLGYKGVDVVADKSADVALTLTNTGKANLGAVVVTGFANDANENKTAALTVDGNGTAFADSVALTGPNKTGTAALTVTGTKPAAQNNVENYNLTAGSVDLAKYSTLTVGAGNDTTAVLVTGDTQVAAEAKVDVKTNAALTLGTLTNAGTVENAGTVTATGAVTNSGSITGAGALTFKGAVANSGAISTTGELVVDGAAFTNSGKAVVSANKLSLNNGATFSVYVKGGSETVDSSLTASEIWSNKGSTFDYAALNNKAAANATANDSLKITNKLVLDGGSVTVAGASTETVDAVVSGNVEVKGDSVLKFKSLTADTANSGLKVGNASEQSAGSVEVGTLNVANTAALVNVNNGTLTVTEKLATKASSTGFTVGATGKLVTTAAALGLSISDQGAASFEVTSKDSNGQDVKETWFNGLGSNANSGRVEVTGIDGKMTIANAATLASDFFGTTVGTSNNGTSSLYLGGLVLSDLFETDGTTIKADKAASVNGLVTDAAKAGIVTGVETQTITGEYKALQLKDGTTEYTVNGDLTLSGNDGHFISYAKDNVQTDADVTIASGKTLTTTGDGSIKIESLEGTYKVASGKVTTNGITGNDGAVEVASEGALTINGNAKVTKLTVDGALGMGTYTSMGGLEQNGALVVDTLNVGATGTLTGDAVTVSGDAGTIAGTATIADLAIASGKTVSVSGTAEVSELSSTGTLTAANVQAFTKDNGYVLADLSKVAKVQVGTLAEDANVTLGEASVVALGSQATAEEALGFFAGSGYSFGSYVDAENKEVNKDRDDLVQNVLYVTTAVADETRATTYAPVAGNVNGTNGVDIADGTLLVLNGDKLDTTGATKVFAKDVTFDGALHLVNVDNGDKILVGTVTQGLGRLEDAVAYTQFTGDVLMKAGLATEEVAAGGDKATIEVGMRDKAQLAAEGIAQAAGFEAAYAMFEQGKTTANTSSVEFNKWLYTLKTAPGSYQDEVTSITKPNGVQIQQAAADVAGLGATTGVQAVTVDAVNQMADTVVGRTSVLTQRAQGVNVWADVNGGKFEAKKLFNGAGYSSDIYSGVLGADYQFTNGAVLGAALTVGTADTDTKNSGVSASTDSDLVGFSVYGSKTFDGIWNVAGDIGYLQASNDVTANGYAHAWKFSQDTDAWTVGVRGEVLTKAGSVSIVPHVGLRYTALSTDGFEAGYVTDVDDQSIFQLPVGVTVAADFQTNGWTVAPKFDLTVVPTFGDKDADLKLGITGVSTTDDYSVRVLDSNPVQATLGVNATNGAWGFGLNYKLGVGSDERANNTFNANVRYAF